MIRICHMTNVHSQTDVRILKKECISLAQRDYEVYLVAPGKDNSYSNVKVYGLGEKPRSRICRMTQYAKKAYKVAINIDADIYHFHDPELIPYGLKLKKKGKKVIFDSHENVLEQFGEKEYIPLIIRKLFDYVYSRYLEYACRKFDAIVSVDPCICDKYRKINHNTIQVTNFPQYRDIISNNVKNKYIGFAGGVSRQWNHEIVINAINNIEGCRYVLCGPADEEYLAYLKSLDGWKKVDYYGIVSHDKALELLSGGLAGVALCSPSRNTNGLTGTLGNTKLFEIMMCGIPVICTNFLAWKEIVENCNTGYCIDVKDQNTLEMIIRELMKEDNIRQVKGLNGRKTIKNIYNWERQVDNLINLYKEIYENEK